MKKSIDLFDKFFHYLTAISFALVSICVLIQVITRYTPGISAPWTDEMTRLFFLYTIMFGAPMAIKYSEYAVIDILTGSLKKNYAIIAQIFSYLIIAVVCAVGSWQALRFWSKGLRSLSTSLQINMGFFYFIPVGIFALTLMYSLLGIVMEIKKLWKGEE